MADSNNGQQGIIAQQRMLLKQTDFPAISLEKALRIAQALWDSHAGRPTPPHEIALGIDFTPTGGGWRELCGASMAYGLTEGSYSATDIKLTGLVLQRKVG